MLREASARFKKGGHWEGMKKAVVIALNDQGNHYGVTYLQAGMSGPEIVALLRHLDAYLVDGWLNGEG